MIIKYKNYFLWKLVVHQMKREMVINYKDWFGLVWFYGISTIVGYLMPKPIFTYIFNTWFANIFCWYTQLNDQTVSFETIKFSMSLATIQPNINHLFKHN